MRFNSSLGHQIGGRARAQRRFAPFLRGERYPGPPPVLDSGEAVTHLTVNESTAGSNPAYPAIYGAIV
jgi:hypothetical protein